VLQGLVFLRLEVSAQAHHLQGSRAEHMVLAKVVVHRGLKANLGGICLAR